MSPEDSRRIIEQLQSLNAQAVKRDSLLRMLWVGVVYGIGFFIGSAIIATIAFGILGPWVGQIPWVRNAFEVGYSLTH